MLFHSGPCSLSELTVVYNMRQVSNLIILLVNVQLSWNHLFEEESILSPMNIKRIITSEAPWWWWGTSWEKSEPLQSTAAQSKCILNLPLVRNKLVVIVVQSLSHVQVFATPWTAACQASLPFTVSWSLLKLMSIESVMPSNHLILCCPLLH